MALHAVEHRGISIRLACQLFVVSECCYRYRRLLSQENQRIADWLVRMQLTNTGGQLLDANLRHPLLSQFGPTIPSGRVA